MMDDSASDAYWRVQDLDRGSNDGRSPGGATTSGARGGDHMPFDPLEHTRLSPSAFDGTGFNSNYFITPRIFTTGEPSPSFGYGDVGVAEPDLSRSLSFRPSDFMKESSLFYSSALPSSSSAPHQSNGYSSRSPTADTRSPSGNYSYLPSNPSLTTTTANSISSTHITSIDPNGPVYAPYGSSVLSLNPSAAYKLPSLSMPPSVPPTGSFSPGALGLPLPPPPGTSTNFAGLYSSSGFDMLGVLARVATRPNQTIQIGPVDTSCSFLVVDARKHDLPIAFCSESFTRLTGYTREEIVGRNCRFLQSPDGVTVQGTPRKYTDSHAAWHMRKHISAGMESQSSLINYHKGGKAFINLVTVVPITWDSDEIAYYVGFQVDLVDQPNAILDRMRDGSYVVNYSLLNGPPKTISMLSFEPPQAEEIEQEVWDEKPTLMEIDHVREEEISSSALLQIVEGKGVGGLRTEDEKKGWNKLMLDNSDDFVHVLSLKGSILYCSPSVRSILEYDPKELIGKTIQSICHPSDIVPVMRELKDSGSIARPMVSLLYRVQRKNSGYVWMEATGKLHVEPGKGRKSVILVGRPRDVYRIGWPDLRVSGGLGETEFWTKFSLEGMVLFSTQSVQNVLGFAQSDMIGTSIYQLTKPEVAQEIQQALTAARQGKSTTLKYKMQGRRTFVEVVTRFYAQQEVPSLMGLVSSAPRHVGIVAQTNLVTSYERKSRGSFARSAPVFTTDSGGSPASDDSSSSAAPVLNTFKTLSHPSVVTDNVFDELDTTRCTSWQYELHQLQILNKKLRDEKDHLIVQSRRKRGHEFPEPTERKTGRSPSESSQTSKVSHKNRSCANCGRTDSPEWRAGPTGLKTLCNACGLRYSKTQKEGASISGAPATNVDSGNSRSPAYSPYDMSPSTVTTSAESSLSPVTWR